MADQTRGRRPRSAAEVKFKNNEPVKPIPGGYSRESTLLDRSRFPAVAHRERLNNVLLNHCAQVQVEAQLLPEDEKLLQRISQETIAGGTHPVVRQRAIWALRFFPTAPTVDLLADLAEFGEDEYVRSHAIGSLGALKLAVALPVLVRKLDDPADRVVSAAEMAIRETEEALGWAALAPLLLADRSGKLRQRLDELLVREADEEPLRRQVEDRREAFLDT